MNQMLGHAYHELPWDYDKGEELAIVFRTDRDVLQQLLPPMMTLSDGPGIATFNVSHHQRSTFGPYLGIYVCMLVVYNGQPMLHRLTGMKSTFSGVAAGREMWGMPLLIGEPTIAWDGDVLNVVARRNGVEFARLSVRLERRCSEPARRFAGMTSIARRPPWEKADKEHVLLGGGLNPADPNDMVFWTGSSVLKMVGGDPGDDWSILPVHEILETNFSFGGHSSLTGAFILEEF